MVALGLALAGCGAEPPAAAPPAAEPPAAAPAPPASAGQGPVNTLERLRTLARAKRLGPELAGLPDLTPGLSVADRAAIVARLKPCHTRDDSRATQAPVRLVAGFDAQGIVRHVALADPNDPDAANPPIERQAWIAQAMRAVVAPECNPLPLPPGVLGRPGRINLRFSR